MGLEGRNWWHITEECTDFESICEIDLWWLFKGVIAKMEDRIYYFYESIVLYNVINQHS